MSNFKCDKCGAPCSDTPEGYVTGCEHYPPDARQLSFVGVLDERLREFEKQEDELFNKEWAVLQEQRKP